MTESNIVGGFAVFILFALFCFWIGVLCNVRNFSRKKPLNKAFRMFYSSSWKMCCSNKGVSFHSFDIDNPEWEIRIETRSGDDLCYVRKYGPSLFGKAKKRKVVYLRFLMSSSDVKLLDRIFNDKETASKSWNFKNLEELEAYLAIV